MLDNEELMVALKRDWDYAGGDEDISHEIYHDDAVLEFPQSGERFEGVANFGSTSWTAGNRPSGEPLGGLAPQRINRHPRATSPAS